MAEHFKGDELELKMEAIAIPVTDDIAASRDQFFEDAFACGPLGELIYDRELSPITDAISREIFIISFKELFEAWGVAGTPEAYLLVFRKIFGDDAIIEFTNVAPGHIQIDIEASGFEQDTFIAREMVDGEYVYDEIIDDVGDTIVFQSLKGIESQYELERALFLLVPEGIFAEINLIFGE